jgi:hypothetical protein
MMSDVRIRMNECESCSPPTQVVIGKEIGAHLRWSHDLSWAMFLKSVTLSFGT